MDSTGKNHPYLLCFRLILVDISLAKQDTFKIALTQMAAKMG